MSTRSNRRGKKIDLVFRSNGERTAEVSLALAIRHIQPDQIHRIDRVKPFSQAVDQMLRIHHDCDCVVYVDADCLIGENLRPFLEFNDQPFVDAVVKDRFRGRVQCGVHILRIDLVRAMAAEPTAQKTVADLLRPESARRNRVMKHLGMKKAVKHFFILHDFQQGQIDLFTKMVLRELRSRAPKDQAHLETAMAHWGDHPDFIIARGAIQFAREQFPQEPAFEELAPFLQDLPTTAREQISNMNLAPDLPLTETDLASVLEDEKEWIDQPKPHKVFGIGLSRTGTHSLQKALDLLGYEVAHYPIDATTLMELEHQHYDLSLLQHLDGLTDITAAAFFKQFDQHYPGSRFVLTLRSKGSWLGSMERHWQAKAPPGDATHTAMRSLLRKETYGTQTFDRDRLSQAYDAHVRTVRSWFKDRPGDLLVMDLTKGDGWKELCAFLNRPMPDVSFPHEAKKKPRGWLHKLRSTAGF